MIHYLQTFLRRRIGSDLSDVPPWQVEIARAVEQFTMTSKERVIATIASVEYVLLNDIPGAVVECGVWKGGNMMAAALTMIKHSQQRPLYLFDTYEGMTAPTDGDVDLEGRSADSEFQRRLRAGRGSRWCEAGLEEVQANLASTGFPIDLLRFVKGPVEQSLPKEAPDAIAVLRLDTDWYSSTKHELTHLYPRVSPRGVTIVDDYGHWRGARKAVDEYLAERRICAMLQRIDNTGRMFIKV